MAKRDPQQIKKFVRERYGARARERLVGLDASESDRGTPIPEASCCGPAEPKTEERLVSLFYSAEQIKDLPEEALSSLGCGNPTAIAGLKEGEHVLDLGSGGGLDCFLAAQKVGPKGKAVGLDMTPDMVELARRNAGKVGLSNVEFHQGEMEKMPFPDDSFDVIISNCVINLSPDKDAVFRESFRVLKPGGRFRVSDIVWMRAPTEKERSDLESWAGCVAGALMVDEYVAKLSGAGFSDVRTRLGDDGGDRGFTSAYVEAEKPVAGAHAVQRTACGESAGQATEESGVVGLSITDKELVALGAAIGAGCHPCTQYHTQAALKAGLDAVEVRWAIEMAQVVRARGGVAVANVGRRILGADQQELGEQAAPPCRGSALVWLGAAAGCNSGVLLAEYAAQAAAVGVGVSEVREAVEIAEMVKTQAGKFLSRDIERALGKAPEPAVDARRSVCELLRPGRGAQGRGDGRWRSCRRHRWWLRLRRRGVIGPEKAGAARSTEHRKVADIMWTIDYFVRASLMMKEKESERLRLVSEARRSAVEGGGARGWLWRIEPGMKEAFEDLQGWLLPNQREATVETVALAERAVRPGEEVRSGAHDQSPVPVGWPVPACCPPNRARPTRDADLAVTGFGVACCGITCCAA